MYVYLYISISICNKLPFLKERDGNVVYCSLPLQQKRHLFCESTSIFSFFKYSLMCIYLSNLKKDNAFFFRQYFAS